MKAEVQSLAQDIKQSFELLRRHLDWDQAQRRLQELNALVEDPKLWDNPQLAQDMMRERTRLETAISAVRRMQSDFDDTLGLIELGEAENDAGIVSEAEAALRRLREEAAAREIDTLLSGEADRNNGYVEIHAGAGGTESQDWANMLLRMYMRWAEKHGHKVEIVELSDGEEAGIKSATIHVKGESAYGWLKTEAGVHRLVRISPFDSNARRHTSFASVWVYPEVDDRIIIEIDEKDVRTDTYRASGAGGQHVNKTDSAVRLTHAPTGIVVQCQSQRSQHKNRAEAWNMLRARLYENELRKREEAAQAAASSKTDIGWGHQIRSYVLQPYQMVKDLRTGVESPTPHTVLDGDLDAFMSAALAARVEGASSDVKDLD
ncbi:MAG TPA: peptide chain release factor 2 [Alphaproteobacteria bacterium]|nr:peptide chain release factor 2 [Alphaproteobacteria bacterium]